jgi:hypothetical protein
MHIFLIFIGVILFTLASTSVQAQPPQPSSPQGSTAPTTQQGKSKKLNVDRFVSELDTNKDGCVRHTEWVAPGLGDFNFQALSGQAEKNDCVTKRELLIGDPPDGIDLDGDGYLTVTEMIGYTKITSGGSGPGSAPQGSMPPAGAATGR